MASLVLFLDPDHPAKWWKTVVEPPSLPSTETPPGSESDTTEKNEIKVVVIQRIRTERVLCSCLVEAYSDGTAVEKALCVDLCVGVLAVPFTLSSPSLCPVQIKSFLDGRRAHRSLRNG